MSTGTAALPSDGSTWSASGTACPAGEMPHDYYIFIEGLEAHHGRQPSTGGQTSTADDWSLQDPSTLKESVGTKLSREEENSGSQIATQKDEEFSTSAQ
jgi:hypothetical protein